MHGIIIEKSVAWRVANSVMFLANGLSLAAIIAVMVYISFTIYVLTGARLNLSLPAIAILACAIALLVRDEVLSLVGERLWCVVFEPILRSCVSGYESIDVGWMLPAGASIGERNLLRQLRSRFFSSGKPIKACKLITTEGEAFIVLWDLKPIHLQHGANQITYKRKLYNFQILPFTTDQ